MRSQDKFSLATRIALVLVCVSQAAACDMLGNLMFGEKYEGPPPAAESIHRETAVVRRIDVPPSGPAVLLIDRVRFTEAGDPHNVNRVVRVVARDAVRDELAALNLGRGDLVVLSTRFNGTVNAIGSMNVPDWPGHGAYEYPIGVHALTEIARVGS